MEEEAWERLGRKEEEEGFFIPPPPNLPVGLGGPRAPGVKTPGNSAKTGHPGASDRAPGPSRDIGREDRAPGGPIPRVPGLFREYTAPPGCPGVQDPGCPGVQDPG